MAKHSNCFFIVVVVVVLGRGVSAFVVVVVAYTTSCATISKSSFVNIEVFAIQKW